MGVFDTLLGSRARTAVGRRLGAGRALEAVASPPEPVAQVLPAEDGRRIAPLGPLPAVAGVGSLRAAAGRKWAAIEATVRAYLALTKPRIVELLLVTTVPSMLVAARRVGSPLDLEWLGLVGATLVGGALGAGAANTWNCVLDRDIDAVMQRTRRRPIPSGRIGPGRAAVFGLALGFVAFVELALLVNLAAAVLTIAAGLFYVLVYTAYLKRRTPLNIVIGGAAGALPPVIGWVAVTGSVSPTALLLFLIVVWWTPPHFWALSLGLVRDYARAGVPMLPVVGGEAETYRQIFRYSLGLVALSAALWYVGGLGPLYALAAVLLGIAFVQRARILRRDGGGARAMQLYHASIGYLAALFAAMALDAIVFAG